jgi:two-component system response regulator FixJ
MGKTVIMVGGDAVSQAGVKRILETAGHRLHLLSSAQGLSIGAAPVPGDCVLLDLAAVGRDGVELLRAAAKDAVRLPVVVTGQCGDVALAVEAMKLGATDFLEKPCRAARFILAIEHAFALREQWERRAEAERQASARIGLLSRRLRQVLRGMALGRPNKVIAYELGLSIRTVEAYRALLLAKLRVRTTAAAIQIGIAAGIHAAPERERPSGHA